MPAENVGTGTTVAITGAAGELADLLEVNWNGIERASIETTTLATVGGRTYRGGTVYDPGNLECRIAFDPSALPSILLARAGTTVVFSDAGAASWAAEGFMQSIGIVAPLEERLEATITVKMSGTITVTP